MQRLSNVTQRLRRPGLDVDSGFVEEVRLELESAVGHSGLQTWVAPLGICHTDHEILGSILPRLVADKPDIRWHVYDDLPYWLERPDARDAAHRRLEQAGLRLEPISTTVESERKRLAVACYRSQVVALGDRLQAAIEQPERIYRLLACSN